jgi:argininosuccinate synthase
LGRATGIGALDLVENRLRRHEVEAACTETPAAAMPSLPRIAASNRSRVDRGGGSHLKDELEPNTPSSVYNGFWFSPEREMLAGRDRQIAGFW